ncbi:hypothetical protein P7K49_003852 [Saguinus oedipus]|uniref:Uncharacterized protein n=1 Tax=Saguinus oedipus TaxID=9490 RepID=A0ABQ9W5Q1_SAGOE|nr:hypothetical protein P7K49_003852 [Saguinus oedipus]
MSSLATDVTRRKLLQRKKLGLREFGWSNETCREPLGINQTGSVIPGREDKDSTRLSDSGHAHIARTFPSSHKETQLQPIQGRLPGPGMCVLSITGS